MREQSWRQFKTEATNLLLAEAASSISSAATTSSERSPNRSTSSLKAEFENFLRSHRLIPFDVWRSRKYGKAVCNAALEECQWGRPRIFFLVNFVVVYFVIFKRKEDQEDPVISIPSVMMHFCTLCSRLSLLVFYGTLSPPHVFCAGRFQKLSNKLNLLKRQRYECQRSL